MLLIEADLMVEGIAGEHKEVDGASGAVVFPAQGQVPLGILVGELIFRDAFPDQSENGLSRCAAEELIQPDEVG